MHACMHAYITLHYITLHYITLHYITLHYITLHYITLHTYIHTYREREGGESDKETSWAKGLLHLHM